MGIESSFAWLRNDTPLGERQHVDNFKLLLSSKKSGNVHGMWRLSVVERIREPGADSTYRPMFVCKMRPQSCPSQLDASWILRLLDQSARPLCGLLRATSCPRPIHETCTPIHLVLKAYLPNAYNGALIANQRREFVF